jgi:hypothetical protein
MQQYFTIRDGRRQPSAGASDARARPRSLLRRTASKGRRLVRQFTQRT